METTIARGRLEDVFVQNVRLYLSIRHMNQNDIADALDIKHPSVSAKMNGKAAWSISDIEKVAGENGTCRWAKPTTHDLKGRCSAVELEGQQENIVHRTCDFCHYGELGMPIIIGSGIVALLYSHYCF